MADLWFQSINNYNSAPLVSPIPDQVNPRGTAFSHILLDNYVDDVENTPDEISWTMSPSSLQHFNITIDSNREAISHLHRSELERQRVGDIHGDRQGKGPHRPEKISQYNFFTRCGMDARNHGTGCAVNG